MTELNLEGLLNTKEKNTTQTKKNRTSRHLFDRRSVGLRFTAEYQDKGIALAYWRDNKLATPLIWLILDKIAENGGNRAEVQAFLSKTTPDEFAKMVLADLRKL